MKIFENRKPQKCQAFETATVGAVECKPLYEGQQWNNTIGNGSYYILGISVASIVNRLKDISIVALGFIVGSVILQAVKHFCNHLIK